MNWNIRWLCRYIISQDSGAKIFKKEVEIGLVGISFHKIPERAVL